MLVTLTNEATPSIKRLLIADFGTAKESSVDSEGTISISGTLGHMAPEVLIPGRQHDPFKADGTSFLIDLSHTSLLFWHSPL